MPHTLSASLSPGSHYAPVEPAPCSTSVALLGITLHAALRCPPRPQEGRRGRGLSAAPRGTPGGAAALPLSCGAGPRLARSARIYALFGRSRPALRPVPGLLASSRHRAAAIFLRRVGGNSEASGALLIPSGGWAAPERFFPVGGSAAAGREARARWPVGWPTAGGGSRTIGGAAGRFFTAPARQD